jgi:hypothetical protein
MPGDRMPHLAPRPIRRFAPRNDNRAVIPRACGGSITPRPLGSSINRQPRHCERSEAIHVTAQRKNGLLRFARKHLRLPAARLARALQIVSPKEKKAQGTPGACCTRGLACKKTIASAHEHTGTVGASRRPCAMALRLMPCSPRRRIRLVTVIGGLKVLSGPVGPEKPPPT